jgi:hypothetical protein
VLGEGGGVRSEEAESKMCDFREVGHVRFHLIREFQYAICECECEGQFDNRLMQSENCGALSEK